MNLTLRILSKEYKLVLLVNIQDTFIVFKYPYKRPFEIQLTHEVSIKTIEGFSVRIKKYENFVYKLPKRVLTGEFLLKSLKKNSFIRIIFKRNIFKIFPVSFLIVSILLVLTGQIGAKIRIFLFDLYHMLYTNALNM